MATAQVAYEGRKKVHAVKPLKWHRAPNGSYTAKGASGNYTVFHRAPDRRHGRFPWVAMRGGMRGVELKPGGFDRADQAKTFASQADAGLCGPPATVAVPAGVFPGTLAGEAGPLTSGNWGEPSKSYEDKVIDEVAKMVGQKRGLDGTLLPTTPDAYQIVGNSPLYVASMERAGVDPTIVASVLIATKYHKHEHDCTSKHVELHEEAKKRRGVPPIFQTLQQRLDAGGYPTVNWPPFHIYFHGGDIYQSGPNAAGALQNFRDEGHDERVIKITSVVQTDNGPIDGGEVYSLEETAAEEAKKRLWQPPPGSGLFITRSSLTRDYWLVKGNHVVAMKPTRGEVEQMAKDMASGASEAPRPKGPGRR